MPSVSAIDPATLRAYRETHYRLCGERAVMLRIGRHCPALAALHTRHGVDCSAFVTACNPLGIRLDDAANARRQARLSAELARRGLPALDGIGRHPRGDWPGEPSLLVPGLDRAAARALGARFAQNALVWSGADAVPELILLR